MLKALLVLQSSVDEGLSVHPQAELLPVLLSPRLSANRALLCSVNQCLCSPVLAEFDGNMEPSSPPDPGIPVGKSSSVPQRNFRVLVGVTGSVAALKLPLLIAELLKITGVSKAVARAL